MFSTTWFKRSGKKNGGHDSRKVIANGDDALLAIDDYCGANSQDTLATGPVSRRLSFACDVGYSATSKLRCICKRNRGADYGNQ